MSDTPVVTSEAREALDLANHLSTLTPQQVFTTVYKHLMTQQCKALANEDEYGSSECAYRSPTGQSCAVGCLIPDTLYIPEIEGHLVGYLIGDEHPHIDLLVALQRVHDRHVVDDWKDELAKVAADHDLEIPS